MTKSRIAAEGRANLDRWLAGTHPLTPYHAASALARQHAHRAAARDVGRLPRVRHRRLREACRHDLLKFGLTYCVGRYEGLKPLLKRPPSERMIKFVRALQSIILNGGLKHVRWPRGKGKSTWVKIAIMWAALYGHCFFMVVVEKTKGMAQVVVEEVWKRIRVSPRISADFPEFSIPMNDVALTPQRMRVQTYLGKPTYMKMDVSRFHYYKLPTMEGFDNTGAIIAYRGADQALRGINIESARPDFFFIDDPQSDEDAKNPATVKKIEDNINGAVLGSGETDEIISAVMASTAIESDDVSETFADPVKHPEWNTETERLVVHWGPEAPMHEYLRRLAIDEADASRWYVEHRAEVEDGAEMMDDSDYVKGREVSAYQHALWLRFTMKDRFFPEYQMLPTKMQGIYHISPKLVRSRVNGHPLGEIPHECDQGVLCYCDVNANAGLRWEIAAFGKGRVVATLAYGQYPENGRRLYPKNTPEAAVPQYVLNAIRVVARSIMSVELHDEMGRPEKVRAICFDGGWQTNAVATAVAELREAGIEAAFSKGFEGKDYSRYHHEQAARGEGLKAAEECHLWGTGYGMYLAINASYWKEVSQTSYMAEPLAPSSSSIWGSEPGMHDQFAAEICGDELNGKEFSTKYGTVYHWAIPPPRPNHYGDCHASLMAFGAIRGNFDSIAKIASLDALVKVGKAAGKKRKGKVQYNRVRSF